MQCFRYANIKRRPVCAFLKGSRLDDSFDTGDSTGNNRVSSRSESDLPKRSYTAKFLSNNYNQIDQILIMQIYCVRIRDFARLLGVFVKQFAVALCSPLGHAAGAEVT